MFEPIVVAAALLGSPPAPMLASLPSMSAPDADEAMQAVEKIIEKFESEQDAFYEKVRAASDEERQAIFEQGQPDPAASIAELRAIAEKHRASDAAARAALWIMSMAGPGADGDWAMNTLLTDFIDSETIASVPPLCRQLSTRSVKTLETIQTKSKNDRARALASYYLGTQLMTMSKVARELDEEGSTGDPYIQYEMQGLDDALRQKLADGDPETFEKAGEAMLEDCVKNHRDVELYAGRGVMIGPRAEGALFEARNLQIGDVAPDIEGVDAEGLTFRLYDYKGQVVVLDFWGFW